MLSKDDDPVACEVCVDKTSSKPAAVRTMAMALWLYDLLQGWIYKYKPNELTVLIETPILNRSERGVTTMMIQMRMLAAYEMVLVDLEGCDVLLGEVHNQTAKAVFTGNGHADKSEVVAKSVWRYRPDLQYREHLADAQAIATVAPTTYVVNNRSVVATEPVYMDGAIGKGAQWVNKHPRTRR